GIEIYTSNIGNGYGFFTGTSAAGPHVVGAAALLKQLHPGWGPEELRNAIVNNAFDLFEPVTAQGAGLLDIEAAVLAGLRCSPDVLAFETESGGMIVGTTSEKVTLNNSRSHQIDGTIEISCYYSADSELIELTTPVSVQDYIKAGSSSFSVPSQSEADIQFQLDIPVDAQEGYYWGTIKFKSATDNITVPFGFQYRDIDTDMGEWVVSSDTTRQHEKLKVTNLTVTNGAKLTLNNVVIFMDSKKDGKNEIKIETGAQLIMESCTVTNFNPSVYYNFSLYGKGQISYSRLSGIYGIYSSPYPGGINIYSDQSSVTNSTVFRCYTNGIFADSASDILIADNYIHHNGGEGILLWESENVVIIRNTFKFSWWDAVGMTGTTAIVMDNEIHNNSYDGIWVNKSSPYIANNIITNCGYWKSHFDSAGIKFQRNSQPIIENNTISDNIYYGLYINGSSPVIFNSTIKGSENADIYISMYESNVSRPRLINTTFNSVSWPADDFSSVLSREWFVRVSAEDETGTPVPGAQVRLKDVNDNVIEDVTGDGGITPYMMVPQYNRTSIETVYRTPYKLEVNKSSVINNTMKNIVIDSNTDINAILAIPDLNVLKITHSPQPAYTNETINFTLTLYNNGTIDLADLNVTVMLDDYTTPFANLQIETLTAYETRDYSFYRFIIESGSHNLSVFIELPPDMVERSVVNNELNYTFTVYNRPIALKLDILEKFTYAHEYVTFVASANATDDKITGYQFDFNDGTVSDWQSDNTIKHVFSTVAYTSVLFRVRTEQGLISNWSEPKWFEILEREESSGISIEPLFGGTIKTTFNFTPSKDLQSGAASIESYRWTFGDGSYSDSMNVTHQYLEDGRYKVLLHITYATDGAGVLFQRWLTVENIPPEASFFASATTVLVGEEVTFDASTTTDIDDDVSTLNYHWNFDDGTESTGLIVTHSFEYGFTYIVTLTVTDDDNESSEYKMEISVSSPPDTADSKSDDKLETTTVAFIIIGILVAILVACAMVLIWVLKQKKKRGEVEWGLDLEEEDEEDEEE
ncbi:MAG: right-handed parallel beta-helix repeat-containing protein, partial [Thermoplasmata archaeon]